MRGVIIKTVTVIFLVVILAVPVHIPFFHSRTSVPFIYASPPRSGTRAGGGGGEGNGNISITGPVAMGISDLGHDSNGSYSYYTSSVLGSITIYKAETSPVNSSFSVQLNSVVTFNSSGERYSYWVQDVAIINPYIHFVTFIDNIWNYSNVHYSIFASSITGNGQIYNYLSSEYYGYGIAPFSISYPVTISMKMVTSNENLLLYYGINNTFTLLDNVSFFASSHPVFYISSASAPSGNPYDLEFVIGGPGGGASVSFSSVNASLSLFRWNGYNYESIPSAANYGINTGESVTNLHVSLFVNSSGGVSAVASVGEENPGFLYSRDDVSTLSVNSTIPGTLYINNYSVSLEYKAILTLYPGNYTLHLVHGNASIYNATISLRGGGITYISIYPKKYAVLFKELGDIPWVVTVDNQSVVSNSSLIQLFLPNGSYDYTVSIISNATTNSSPYYPFPSSGIINVDGSNVTVQISLIIPSVVSFLSNHYPVDVYVNGIFILVMNSKAVFLPSGNLHLVFPLIYGPYGTVLCPFGSLSNVSLNYSGSNKTISVNYTTDYLLNLNVTGGGYAEALLKNHTLYFANKSFYVPAGSIINLKAYYDLGKIGFGEWYGQGNGSYSGDIANVTIIMNSPINETAIYSTLYYLQISVNGYFSGDWHVLIGNRSLSFSGNNATIPVVNGNYIVKILPPNFFVSVPSVFNVSIRNGNASIVTSFQPDYQSIGRAFETLFLYERYSFYLDAFIVVFLGLIVVLAVRRKRA